MTTTLLINCLKIFCCRILDVTMGTMRTVLTVKEKTLPASLFAFCEVFIWFMIVRDALKVEGNTLLIAASYAAGYATGTFIGGRIAALVIKGNVVVRVITSERDRSVPHKLREAGFGIAVLEVIPSEYKPSGRYMIVADVPKQRTNEFEDLVRSMDPSAFFIVEEVKSQRGGYQPSRK